jgi:drug/metabolite transporter (DMT)-like permease
MAATRFFTAGIVLGLFVAVTSGFRATWKQWFDNSILGGLFFLGGNGLVAWAEKSIPSGITTLIVSLCPLFIVLFDWAAVHIYRDGKRGTTPNRWTFLGILLGFAGLALLVGPSLQESSEFVVAPLPLVALIVACTTWSVGSVYAKYLQTPASPFTAAAIQMFSGSIWLAIAGFGLGEWNHFEADQVTRESVFAWAYLVVAGSLIAFTAFVWLMKHASPTMVSTYAYINPIVAVYLGWLLLDEPVSARIFISAAVIILGVAIITLSKRKRKTADAAKVVARSGEQIETNLAEEGL